jgi:hypothetical protein
MLTSTSEEFIKKSMTKLGLSTEAKSTSSSKHKGESRTSEKKTSVSSIESKTKATKTEVDIEEPRNLKVTMTT